MDHLESEGVKCIDDMVTIHNLHVICTIYIIHLIQLYVNQDAFNRDIHQEVEKINEDRIGRRSPSRTDRGVQQQQQQTTNANNAAQRCTVS